MKVVARRKMEGKSLIKNRLLLIMPVKGEKKARLAIMRVILALILILNQRTEVTHKMKTTDVKGYSSRRPHRTWAILAR